jgi:alkanesulfonate monooxygenase SsuD/methylene tetrahydromethanopterin reductase-like flavin-dependent oxidoreductase (luciferase family)
VEGCERVGRAVDPADWRVARSIFVADDDKTARSYVTAPNSPYRLYYANLLAKLKAGGRTVAFKESPDMPDEAVTVDYVMDKLVIWGSPEKVADDILAFRAEVGDFGTLLYAGKDWLDRDLGRRSMILMAERVLPVMNGANRG